MDNLGQLRSDFCLRRLNHYDLIDWWEMRQFELHKVEHCCELLCSFKWNVGKRASAIVPEVEVGENDRVEFGETLSLIAKVLKNIGLVHAATAAIDLQPEVLAINKFPLTNVQLVSRIEELERAIRRDMKLNIFLSVPPERADLYRNPLEGWEPPVVTRFPRTQEDIEEAGKCFSLDRYAATVFHIMLVAEIGVVELGDAIEVKNPKKGWGSVIQRAGYIVTTTYSNLSPVEKSRRPLVEQLYPLMLGMQKAWRDKISHVENKMVVMTGEFKPEVTLDIVSATKAFMRRLAIDL